MSEKSKIDMLKEIQLQSDKKFGKGAVITGGEIPKVPILCSTGSLKLDSILAGGIPEGRIIEIYGPESGGKTTQTLHMIRECQLKGGIAAFVDAEQTFDPVYASNIGINTDDLILSVPDYGEQGMEMIQLFIENGVDLIVIDSVSALQPKAVIDGEFTDHHMGVQARMMSKSLPKILALLKGKKTSVIWINQIREKIGVMFGSPETTSGGNALKFYASIRMRVSRGGVIGSKDDPDGFETKVKLQKSKVSRPYNSITTNLYLGKNDVWGFSNSDEIIDLATEKEYITKAGAWFKFEYNGNEERFQGKDSLREYFSINTDAYNFFKDQVMSEFAIQNAPISEQAEEGSFNDVTKEKPERKKRKKKDDENLEEVAIEENIIDTTKDEKVE